MEYGQLSQGDVYATKKQGIAEVDVISTGHVAPSLLTCGIGPGQLAPHRSPSSYTPRFTPSPAATNVSTYFPGREEVTPLYPTPFSFPPPTTPAYTRNLPTTLAGPNLYILGVVPSLDPAGGYSSAHGFGYQRSNRETPAVGSPEPHFPLLYGVSGSSRGAAHNFDNRVFTSGDVGHQNQTQVMYDPSSRASHLHNPGLAEGAISYRSISVQNPVSSVYHTASTSGRVLEASGDYRNLYAGAGSWYMQIKSPALPPLSQPNGGRIDLPEYAGRSSLRSLSDERAGNEGHIGAVLPNLSSVGIPDRSKGVQPFKKGKKARKYADHVKFTPGRKFTPRRKYGNTQDPKGQVSATPIGTRGPTYLVEVQQKRYKCPTRQDSWEVATVDFGGIRLTDALDPSHPGPKDSGDKVLDYEGVGSTISCRINFAGGVIGKPLKILTTNNKNPQGPITKKKLAFEVAKLVRRCIEGIKNQPGCADVTLWNLRLMRLDRVSRASWQPVLCYEVSMPPHKFLPDLRTGSVYLFKASKSNDEKR